MSRLSASYFHNMGNVRCIWTTTKTNYLNPAVLEKFGNEKINHYVKWLTPYYYTLLKAPLTRDDVRSHVTLIVWTNQRTVCSDRSNDT